MKMMWKIVVILIILFALAYFIFPSGSSKENDDVNNSEETKETTGDKKSDQDDSDETIKENVDILVSFNEDVTENQAKSIFDDLNVSVKDHDKKTNDYLITYEGKRNVSKLMNKLTDNDHIQDAFRNTQAREIDSNDVFKEALESYEGNANTFIKPDIDYTFLYPSEWLIEDNKIIKNTNNDSEIDLEVLNNKIDDIVSFADSKKPNDLKFDGDIDEYNRQDGSTVYKWLITDGETLRAQGVVHTDKGDYFFDANPYVSFSDFALITDSFVSKSKE